MDIAITELKMDDVSEVALIEKECFSEPWSEQNFIETIEKDSAYYYVARKEDEQDGEILGYCGAYGIVDEGDINQVAVKASYRNCGIAKKLVEKMIEDLEKDGFKEITLEVRASNEPAIHLYKNLGFIEEGVRKNFYAKPTEDALIMWRHQNIN